MVEQNSKKDLLAEMHELIEELRETIPKPPRVSNGDFGHGLKALANLKIVLGNSDWSNEAKQFSVRRGLHSGRMFAAGQS